MIANRIKAPARLGLVAQNDIIVAAGDTGLDANTTSFFQALGIATKIVKKCIEISSDVLLVKTGQKVGASEAALLDKLGLQPFSFGLHVKEIYDNGTIFTAEVLDITDDVIQKHVQTAIKNIASLSLAAKFPTTASVPHMLFNAYKNILSVGLSCEQYSFPAIDKVKEALKNAVSAPVATAAAAAPAGASKKAAAAAPVKEESEEEMGFGLFD